jgi:hypothetical protein
MKCVCRPYKSITERGSNLNFLLPPYHSVHHSSLRWAAVNNELDTNVGESKNWKDLDIDEIFVDWKTSLGKFEEIETVVLKAQKGKANSPQSSWTLLHWAAHCNKTWPISQFLLDTEKALAALAEKQALEQAQALALQEAETAKQSKALQEAKALANKTAGQTRIAAEKALQQKIAALEAEKVAREKADREQIKRDAKQASSSSSTLKKPTLDETSDIQVQFTISYKELVFGTDVYSLAIVLWEIAAREIPYTGADAATIKDSVKTGERETIPEDCYQELSQIITACWETKPQSRLTSSQAAEKLSVWCSLFKGEPQIKIGVNTRTEIRQGFQKMQKILEEGQVVNQQLKQKMDDVKGNVAVLNETLVGSPRDLPDENMIHSLRSTPTFSKT